jgi:pSer/pThr/pTyr-binding forkhead associated (FHA) protein
MTVALRFISGKYQGGEFPVEENREIVVGRSSDLDLVLVEEMVSRKHARLKLVDGAVEIEDLGSTNGTFVNGERINHARLKEGDRILIGSNILKVVNLGADHAEPATRRGSDPNEVARPATVQRRSDSSSEARMSGDLAEIPLPDLLQLFGTSRKTAVLEISTGSRVGKIYLKQGTIVHADVVLVGAREPSVVGLKAIYRMIAWPTGTFELNPPETREFEKPLDVSVQEVLMEGFRQKDEYEQIRPRMPAWDESLRPARPMGVKLRDLKPEELDVFQCALEGQTVGGTLDVSPQSDLDTARVLLDLVERGYLRTSD